MRKSVRQTGQPTMQNCIILRKRDRRWETHDSSDRKNGKFYDFFSIKCERRCWFPAAKTMIPDAFDIRSHWLPINNIFMMTSNGRWMDDDEIEWIEYVKGMMLWHHCTKNKDVIKMIFDSGSIIKLFLFRLNWMTANSVNKRKLCLIRKISAGNIIFFDLTWFELILPCLVCFDGRKLFFHDDGKGGCTFVCEKKIFSFF